MRKIIISLLLLCMHFSTRGQTPYEYRYWFDGDISTAVTGSTTSDAWRMEIDLSRLTESFHTIHLQVTDEKGVSSSPATRCFFLSREGGALTNGYYWFDNEVQTRNVRGDVQGSLTFDVSELQEGFHTIHYQVLREDGLYSQIETRSFYKMQSDQIVGELTFMCYIDGKDFKQERVSVENGAAVWFLDVSELPIGFHKLQVKAIMQNGASTSIREAFFLRSAMDAEMEALSCVFSIDGKPYKTIESGVHEGVFRCDLDVAGLSDGLHKIAYMFTNGKGAQTNIKSQYFVKTPVGGNSIKMYQYWINDNDDMAHTVEQTEVTDPLKLITLLPVEPQPIRSSLFHFETKSGKPMMYAKNEIHLRFYDNSGRWVDASDQYIDYAFGKEVKPVGKLQATQSFSRVATNDVRWYTLQAAPGDTVAFKLSQPATLQLFAPSGEEVFKTSESASVNWGGTHTWENGTYYLAVHDVTGSREDMTLDYMHMDKYDVVDWDVHRVGNGGCSTITFKGNGFRDLYAVDLVIAPGDTIHSVDVSHDSDAETAVTFDFTGATLGDYNAVFHFTEEDKPIANVVTVEEAVDIELATDVSFPSSFLRGTSTTYTIKITNKGNMTAYAVPLSMHISSNTTEGISHLKINGLVLKSLYDYVTDKEKMSMSELNELKELSDKVGEDHYFVKVRGFDENINDSITIRSACFFVNLSPCSTTTITIIIDANEMVELWAGIPDYYDNKLIGPSDLRKNDPAESFCCYHEKIECIADAAAAVADMAALLLAAAAPETAGTSLGGATIAEIAGCVSSAIGSASSFSATIACDRDKSLKDKLFSFSGLANGISTIGAMLSCDAFKKLKKLKIAAEMVVNIGRGVTVPASIMNCSSAFKKKPGCPPKPPKGGKSTPVNSWEPNEIYGYVAESGSKAIKEGHTDVFYTIQFENDTVFATAPAHDIYLTDTLDVNLFDLSTYRPTRIKIGDKSMELTGERNFISTMDMRPAINAIAQIEGTINDKNGIVRWHISSLDPMTMEPSDDPMVGVLPVNFDGSGLGEASFDISLKPNLPDGTVIPNRSGNVFDNNETVLTPTWTNVVDAVPPTSSVTDCTMVNDSTLRIFADGFDARSGVWKYEWYVQHGENAPWWKEGETESPSFDFHFFPGFDYGLCVVVTDSAGNVEKKQIARERLFKSYGKDYEDGVPEVLEAPSTKAPADGDVYDLSGRKRSEPQENDINIINKKKVFIQRKKQ